MTMIIRIRRRRRMGMRSITLMMLSSMKIRMSTSRR